VRRLCIVSALAALVTSCGVDAEQPDGGCCGPGTVFDPDRARCVECLGDDDCDGQRCDEASGTCVTCALASDCEHAFVSRCDERHQCAQCELDEDCAHIPGLPACQATEGCVQCSAENETACGATVCDVESRRCTDRAEHGKSICDECISDRECDEGQLCVRIESSSAIAHCVWRFDAEAPGPGGGCFAARPLVYLRLMTSVNGVTSGVCAPMNSCEALRDFRTTACEIPSGATVPTYSPDCGYPGHAGALCAPSGLCTLWCSSHEQCPCVTPDCSAHYACTEYRDPISGDSVRACDFERTCTFDDPTCYGVL
jgi:hypothetical protein